MPKIIITQPFKFAHHGYQVEEFQPSTDVCETTDECAQVAVAEGWATFADEITGDGTAEEKAAPEAPENKDAAPKRRTKAEA